MCIKISSIFGVFSIVFLPNVDILGCYIVFFTKLQLIAIISVKKLHWLEYLD